MAVDNVKILKINTDEAQRSTKDLKKELKSLKDTMLSTEQGTEEYNAALAQAAEITHTLREQTEEIRASAMDFGQIASNTTKAVGGMVAGFQAAKATLNLFGVENEEVTKSLEKMQNLMAITQALPSIDSGVKAFRRLGLAIKTSTTSLNGFQKALVATGIGAAVVAVGMLVANWDKLTDAINRSIKAAEAAAQALVDNVKSSVNAIKSSLNELNTMSDAMIKNMRELSWQKLKEAVSAEELGVSAEQLIAMQNRMAKAKNEANATLYNETKEQLNAILSTHEASKAAFEAFIGMSQELHNREVKASETATKRVTKAANTRTNTVNKTAEAEAKALENLRKKYSDLSEEIKLFGTTEYTKDLNTIQKEEDAALAIVKDSLNKGIISTQQAEEDKLKIINHYAKLREDAAKKEAERERNASIELIETTYQLEQVKLQKQYDENLITEQYYNDRKKELLTNYVQDYVDGIQYILDTETDLTATQILDLTKKINSARELLKPKEDNTKSSGETLAHSISEAINASALALSDFSDNPAWSNILKNIATITANWDELHEKMKKGGSEAFTAYADIAAAGLGAVANMLNGLAAEQDVTNKEGFESQKNLQVAGATMSMLAGITSAWASSMTLPPPTNIIFGTLLSSMMLATGIAQINKIKQQQFDSGSNVSSTPNAGAVASVIAPVQYTQDVQGASIEGAIKDTKVYVTETDISNTQKKVEVTENEARY